MDRVDKSEMTVTGITPLKLTLSVPEAAAEIGVSERYMYELMKRTDCTYALHLGRKLRVVRSEFEKWLYMQVRQ